MRSALKKKSSPRTPKRVSPRKISPIKITNNFSIKVEPHFGMGSTVSVYRDGKPAIKINACKFSDGKHYMKSIPIYIGVATKNLHSFDPETHQRLKNLGFILMKKGECMKPVEKRSRGWYDYIVVGEKFKHDFALDEPIEEIYDVVKDGKIYPIAFSKNYIIYLDEYAYIEKGIWNKWFGNEYDLFTEAVEGKKQKSKYGLTKKIRIHK